MARSFYVCVLTLSIVSLLCIKVSSMDSVESEKLFASFVIKFNKFYVLGSNEYMKRLQIFRENMKLSEQMNAAHSGDSSSAQYGVTPFSDITREEFRQRYLSTYNSVATSKGRDKPLNVSLPNFPHPSSGIKSYLPDIPVTWDWRNRGVVTSVRNQGDCGGCWAVTSVEAIESSYAIRTGKLQELSVQQMIDCSIGYGHRLYGCKGGYTCSAMSWMIDRNIGLTTEGRYPFAGKEGPCKSESYPDGVHLKNFTCYLKDEILSSLVGHEDKILKILLAQGPLAVAVDATNWQNYMGGIVQWHCGMVPNNHAVSVVGYDLTGPVPYYIVRNSWGSMWGHEGYLYVRYGKNACGIAEEVVAAEAKT